MNFITDSASGFQFFTRSNNSQATAQSSSHGNFIEHSLIRWCEQFVNETFVDVGSNLGAYAIILGKKCKKVISFEPQKEIFDCCILTKCINNSHNVIFENVALGSSEEQRTLYSDPDTLKSSFQKVSPQSQPSTVSVKTLDSYNLKNVDFLRIDAGGSEFNVIKGSGQTLINNNFPPLIFQRCEAHDALCAYLRGLGYTIHPISGYNTMFLASDNTLRKKEPETPIVPPKFDLHKLADLYKTQNYEAIESLIGDWILTPEVISLRKFGTH